MRRPSAWLVLLLLGALSPAPVFAQLQITARAASLSVGGLFQTQYSVSSADGDGGAANAVDDFFVRRARILIDLKVGTALDGRIEPDFGGGGVGVGLADLYARMTFGRGFRLSAGQFKRAFSQFELASDTDLPTIERDARIEGVSGCPGVGGVCSFSRLAGRLQFDERDIGLRAEGDLGTRLQYMATLTNGEGRNAADVNDAKSVSGRLTFILARALGDACVARDVSASGLAAVAYLRDLTVKTRPMGNSLVQIVRINVVAGFNGTGWHRASAMTVQYAVVEAQGQAI